MKRTLSLLLLAFAFSFVTSCSPATPASTPQAIIVQYTVATTPWLADLYTCAGNNTLIAEPRSADFLDLQAAELAIRIGQPSDLDEAAYQIGNEEILVIVNARNPLHKLTFDQVHGLFGGQITNWKDLGGSNAAVQVWVFSSGEDVQQIFDQTVLSDSPVTSTARLATTPDEMAQAVAEDVNAVGILTGHWKAEGVSNVYTVTTVPVLVITSPNSSTAVNDIVVCMQK